MSDVIEQLRGYGFKGEHEHGLEVAIAYIAFLEKHLAEQRETIRAQKKEIRKLRYRTRPNEKTIKP